MLFFLIDVLFRSPGRFLELLPVVAVVMVAPLILGHTIHEFAHALAAHLLGDDTAKRAGRLSLNPLRHMDPTGPLFLVISGIGWGKPVPVDPRMLPDARRSMAIVAFAGPLSNLVTAAAIGLVFKLGLVQFHPPEGIPYSIGAPGLVGAVLAYGMFFNLLLGVFNLLPIAPLDGSKVLMGLAPRRLSFSLARLEPYGMVVLMLVFAVDWVGRAGIFWRIVSTPANFLGSLFVGQPFL